MPATGSHIFSLLAAYGSERGGELPGNWFVAMLEPLGIPPDTVRQSLYRLTKSKAVTGRKVGPVKLYRLTRYGETGTDAGTNRILRPPEPDWDGHWLLVSYQFHAHERVFRDLVNGLLRLEGFAALARGTYLHPRDRSAGLLDSLDEHGLKDRLTMFRARQVADASDQALIGRLWDLERLREGYSRFIGEHGPLTRRSWTHADPSQALQARLSFIERYLDIAWQDPGLPLDLLPADWPAARAQEVASSLYHALHAPLLGHGDAVMDTLNRS